MIISARLSRSMMRAVLVLPETTAGMIKASAIRGPDMP
jgi:hypothetical protein